jgi:exodeoxyribonuclease VII large subunit
VRDTAPQVYSVAQINAIVRELVEGEFSDVAISGEASNVRVHSSGHVYFKLKDSGAQLSAVCFRGDARLLDFRLEDGVQVIARGRLTVYEAQGSYQLVARTIEPAGRGDLERAFRMLVARLQAEGLFDDAHKRRLPRFPAKIAVITSPTGAAIRDILSTLRRRFPCVEVLVIPVVVQGEAAAPQIVRALDAVSERSDIDVAIVGRGGGSIEDLWAFNDEGVARAIHRCSVPVISAVGHESDVTIADFVADRRAATPTMAAEIAVPDRADVLRHVAAVERSLSGRTRDRIERSRRRIAELVRSYALGRVRGRIEHAMQGLDFTIARMTRAERTRARDGQACLAAISGRLSALDPHGVLRRGYAVCAEAGSGRVVRDAVQALSARDVRLTFHDGEVAADVRAPIPNREAS